MAAPRVVGEYPDLKRQAIRSPVNPMDRSTIVSIFPVDIDEVKHTIFPGRFSIPAGSYEKPSILVVGASSWWRETDPEQPLLEVPQGSIQVANSIVIDYINGLFMCDMAESQPGLFYIPGALGLDIGQSPDECDLDRARAELAEKHQHLVDVAKTRQTTFFERLVSAGDEMWARSNHNPRCISELMRIAAAELKLDKQWAKDAIEIRKENCPACGELYDANFPICRHCQTVVDMDAYKKLGLARA